MYTLHSSSLLKYLRIYKKKLPIHLCKLMFKIIHKWFRNILFKDKILKNPRGGPPDDRSSQGGFPYPQESLPPPGISLLP